MKFVQKNASLLLVGALLATTTVPHNVQAQTLTDHKMEVKVSEKKVAQAFDKFQYDMTVEWDQRDPHFKEQAQRELQDSLMKLKAEGVSEKDILAYMQSNILDEKARKDYTRLLDALKTQNLSEEEASSVAMKYMEKNYTQGVGFTGGGSRTWSRLAVVAGVLIVGVVTYLIIKDHKDHEDDCDNSGDVIVNVEVNVEAEAEADAEAEAGAGAIAESESESGSESESESETGLLLL